MVPMAALVGVIGAVEADVATGAVVVVVVVLDGAGVVVVVVPDDGLVLTGLVATGLVDRPARDLDGLLGARGGGDGLGAGGAGLLAGLVFGCAHAAADGYFLVVLAFVVAVLPLADAAWAAAGTSATISAQVSASRRAVRSCRPNCSAGVILGNSYGGRAASPGQEGGPFALRPRLATGVPLSVARS